MIRTDKNLNISVEIELRDKVTFWSWEILLHSYYYNTETDTHMQMVKISHGCRQIQFRWCTTPLTTVLEPLQMDSEIARLAAWWR